ncbi:MAG: hypothetical protein LV481_06800 [Methylacidiphilales bacterium]|nr:hypothetical protein [Candidatus Methylacidiphilales bacterium]
MGHWDDYKAGLHWMLEWLNKLQNDKEGFYFPNHPDRKNVSPAAITALRNGVEFYSETHPEFLYFKETVIADYSSPTTSPETFQKPIYFELKALLEKELVDLESHEI